MRLLFALLLGLTLLSPARSAAESSTLADEDTGDDSEDDTAEAPAPSSAPAPLRVTVEGSRTRSPLTGLSSTTVLTRRDLEVAAGAFDDTLRALHALPGVSGDTASRVTFFVRSAPAHELQIEIDGIPLRRVTHSGEIASAFQRDLLHSVTLEAGGMPVRFPQGLAGGLRASYIDGPTDRFDGSVDLSMLAASGHIAVDLDKSGRHSLVVGARQSLLPLYMAAAEAAGAFEGTVPEASSTEVFARWTARPRPGHRIRTSFLFLRDRLLFNDVDERHHSIGGSIDWQQTTEDGAQRGVQLVHVTHETEQPAPLDPTWEGPFGFDREHRTQLRAFAGQNILGKVDLSVGAEVASVARVLEGQFEDWRSVPSWVWTPLADPATPRVELTGRQRWGEVAVWTEAEHRGERLEVSAGARFDVLNRSRRSAISGRFRARVLAGPKTRLSFGAAVARRERSDALLFGPLPETGLPGPEQASHLDLSFEQDLADLGVFSILAWHRSNSGLVVWGDDIAAPGEASNDGTGQAWGLQTQLALQRDRVRFAGHYSIGSAYRTNPRATHIGPSSSSLGDPRHSIRAAVDVVVGKQRSMLLSGEYTWDSPWAVATFLPVPTEDGGWLWAPEAWDRERTEGSHRLSVRWEHTFNYSHWKLRATVAVAGVPGGSGPVRDCPPTPGEEDGDVPQCRTLDFLPPVMPWLGLRAEW